MFWTFDDNYKKNVSGGFLFLESIRARDSLLSVKYSITGTSNPYIIYLVLCKNTSGNEPVGAKKKVIMGM